MPDHSPKPPLTRRQLLDLAEQLMLEASKAKAKPKGYVKKGQEGSVRDPAVKALAAIALNRLRSKGVSYEEIGAMLGVSRERMRQLSQTLLDEFAEEVEKSEARETGS